MVSTSVIKPGPGLPVEIQCFALGTRGGGTAQLRLTDRTHIALPRRRTELLEMYEDVARFYSPDVCFVEAKKYILHADKRRGLNSALAVDP